MNLDDAQKKKVAGWIDEGMKLSEIQTRISSELGLNLTYIEVRLLVDDLKLTPKDPAIVPVKADLLPLPPAAPAPGARPSGKPGPAAAEPAPGAGGGLIGSKVTV